MHIYTVTIAAALGATAHAGVLDLALTELSVLGVTQGEGYWEIYFQYTVQNTGDVAFDPEGPNDNTDLDNASIQTYLWNNDGGEFYAASGWAILDAPVIAPGESFSGTFTANTVQLPDPLDFGKNAWLVVDLQSTGEEPEHMSNNRVIAYIPTPGVIGLCGITGLVAGRRRR